MSFVSDGIKAMTKNTRRSPKGSRSSMEGGGDRGGSTSGSINSDAVTTSSTRKDSTLKQADG